MSKLNLPSSLMDGVKKGFLVPFIGSGASLPIQKGLFPTWLEVLNSMKEKLDQEGKSNRSDIVKLYLTENRLLEAAQEAVKSLGLADFHKVMQQLFLKQKTSEMDLTLQTAIWRLNPKLVVTTNYDEALEWANNASSPLLNHQSCDFATLLNFSNLTHPRVWHIHGQIKDLGSLILAPEQYDNFYSSTDSRTNYIAARKQLAALITNFPLIFIGFGFNDEYVLNLLESVLVDFKGGTPKSFALMKYGDQSYGQLWQKYNIQVITYEDHGKPLLELLSRISPVENNTIVNESIQATEKTLGKGFDLELPSTAIKGFDTRTTNVGELISSLEDHFSFRWEKESFQHQGSESVIVYWPIRLRAPSAIHGVQSFAAAALQRFGAKIVLCLDDLGEEKFQISSFQKKIKQWFRKVGEDPEIIEFKLFSEILNTRDASVAWNHVQKWLGGQGYDLQTVLQICKLFKVGMNMEEFLARGTGRLLTPGVVWACLSHLLSENRGIPFMTLGGYDECNLWKAWREKIEQGSASVGHLYIPELSNTHMERVDLKWHAKSDIERTIRDKSPPEDDFAKWNSPNEILKWSMTGCVLLPSFIKSGCNRAQRIDFDTNSELHGITRVVTNKIAEWML
jgi:hypothetical protein